MEGCADNMGIKFCPNCGSREIKLAAGGSIGIYECKKCGFRGSIFPEIELNKKIINRK